VPEFFIESVEGKNILIVKIFSGALKPYFLKKLSKNGGIYIRVGATNRQADAEADADLERQRRNVGFDEEIDGEYDFKTLEYSFLKDIFKKIRNKDIDFNSLINIIPNNGAQEWQKSRIPAKLPV
jgi:ATP-dependent DNA helicase RecG